MRTQAAASWCGFQTIIARLVAPLRMGAWLSLRTSDADARRLHVAERVALGEKSFVTVVEVEGRRFLLSNGPNTISLLTELSTKGDFGQAIDAAFATPAKVRPRKSRAARPSGEGISA